MAKKRKQTRQKADVADQDFDEIAEALERASKHLRATAKAMRDSDIASIPCEIRTLARNAGDCEERAHMIAIQLVGLLTKEQGKIPIDFAKAIDILGSGSA